MNEIIISTLDMARLRTCISKARSGSLNAPVDLTPLTRELDRAKVLTPEKMPKDRVTMNSIVKLEYLNNQKSLKIQLVYPESSDSGQNKISVFAPVATAILGCKHGDVVSWKVPSGEALLRISEIIYQPEAAGDLNL